MKLNPIYSMYFLFSPHISLARNSETRWHSHILHHLVKQIDNGLMPWDNSASDLVSLNRTGTLQYRIDRPSCYCEKYWMHDMIHRYT